MNNLSHIKLKCKNCTHEFVSDLSLGIYTCRDIAFKTEHRKKFLDDKFRCPECKEKVNPILVLDMELNEIVEALPMNNSSELFSKLIKKDSYKNKLIILDDYKEFINKNKNGK